MDYIRGINFAPFPRRGVLGAASARASLEKLLETTAANHIILTPSGIQETPQSETIDFRGEGSPEDGELRGIIAFAQSLGLKVILKPTVNCRNGVWRAFINFFDHEAPCEPQWGPWFASHGRFQLHYARLAEETGCVMFIAGCEMVMAERREPEWRELIRQLRGVFSGPLSYNADKYQEDALGWWDCVDIIASSGYYPWGSWETELDRIERLVKRFAKPFFFAETGCMSVAGASKLPNDWKLAGESAPEEQARWYADMFARTASRPWVEGFGLWSWPAVLPGDPLQDRGYSIYGKPAAETVRSAFLESHPSRPL
ncbi:MAG: hypothetical protein LBT11_02535 [Treponema sp.]|jgi:hypothetical protein|nr:hypothetical protein [Treponema sp.]